MTDKEAAARNLRERQRADWGAVAGGWQRYREKMSGPTRVITEKMRALARPHPGDRVLDLACGVGDPAFALAEKVGPAGRVLGLDFSPEMVEAARAWAEQHGVPNVEFRAITSELELDVEPDSFDVAMATSKLSGSTSSSSSLVMARNSTLGTPCCSAHALAASTISGEKSRPRTRPAGPTFSASAKAGSPTPQARSRTRSPGCGRASARIFSVMTLVGPLIFSR